METIWKLFILALVTVLVILCQVLAGLLFHNNFAPLYVLFPMFLTPVPFMLLRCCGGDDLFSTSRGLHWAEFMTGFFATGMFAIPILLGITKDIEWAAAATSLAGSLLAAASIGVRVCVLRKDEEEVTLTSLFSI